MAYFVKRRQAMARQGNLFCKNIYCLNAREISEGSLLLEYKIVAYNLRVKLENYRTTNSFL